MFDWVGLVVVLLIGCGLLLLGQVVFFRASESLGEPEEGQRLPGAWPVVLRVVGWVVAVMAAVVAGQAFALGVGGEGGGWFALGFAGAVCAVVLGQALLRKPLN